MNLWQALFMGLLQGATELFPVSSLGHAVLIPSLLHWSFKQSDPSFLPFLVLLHLGTAGALLLIAGCLFSLARLRQVADGTGAESIAQLGARNISRRRGRSLPHDHGGDRAGHSC